MYLIQKLYMLMQRSSHALDNTVLLRYELVPPHEHGQFREAKLKANLKNALKVKVFERRVADIIDDTFLVGCEILWIFP